MDNNKLFLNSDKTHLLIMCSSKMHSNHEDFNITLNTGSEIIKPSQEERLLGANVTNDFLWKSHLRDHKKSVISLLKTKNNALSILCHYSSFRTRKMFANGLIMSHILYQCWYGMNPGTDSTNYIVLLHREHKHDIITTVIYFEIFPIS